MSLLALGALSIGPLAVACSGVDPAPPAASVAPSAAARCLPDAGGFLRAHLRGAINTDLDWHDADIHCEGGARPDGGGLRVSIAGPLPASVGEHAGRTLRFVFGIETGAAVTDGHALATNLTAILEGDAKAAGGAALYATRGDDKCTVDHLQRRATGSPANALAKSQDYRVDVRGFCLGPASSLDGQTRLHVTTFDFAGRVSLEPPPNPKAGR